MRENIKNILTYISGDEKYLKEECLEKIKKVFLKNETYEEIRIDTSNLDEAISAIIDPLLISHGLLIIIDILENIKNTDLEKIAQIFYDLDTTADILEDKAIIFYDQRIDQKKGLKNPLLEKIQKLYKEEKEKEKKVQQEKQISSIYIYNFDKIKEEEIFKFTSNYCKKIELNLYNEEIAYILDNILKDPMNITMELEKLRYLDVFSKSKDISKSERIRIIDESIYKMTSAIIYEITNIIFSNVNVDKNQGLKKAIEKLDNLKESPYIIQMYLYKFFKNLYLAKLCEIENEDVSKVLNLPKSQKFLEKKFSAWAKQMEYNRIKFIYDQFQNLIIDQRNFKVDILNSIKQILALI